MGAARVGSGRLAQLAERQLYTLDVTGSSPVSPTPGSRDPTGAPECERKRFFEGYRLYSCDDTRDRPMPLDACEGER